MNVNIVLWQDKHIIPRMAEWLNEAYGWTISNAPDNSADVNYYLPYLKWEHHDHPPTKTAAWFTHFEKGTEWKEDKWDHASMWIDKPLVTTDIYLPMFDNASRIIPGVDMDLFYPIDFEAENKTRPIAGIVGMGQPRKGPHLVVDLFYGRIPLDIRIVGDGWPFPATLIPHHVLVQFYAMIDFYLCTSLIEGIPGPVLEALACDKKVVVPHGVGICDELPEMVGIRHYQKGNAESLMNAIEFVLTDEPKPGMLRDVVGSMYTKEQWCSSHFEAMERLLDASVSVQMS